MANETNVGGIIAPVRAEISDFMQKFDQVNEQTNKVSQNVINRLDMMSRALHDVNAQAKAFDVKVPSNATKSIDDVTSKYKSLQQQVKQASVEMEKAWTSNGKGFEGAKKNYEEALNKLVTYKKESGTISIGQEKGIYSNMARGIDQTSASYKVLTDRIKDLKTEQKGFNEVTSITAPKASVTPATQSNVAELIRSSQITDGIKIAKQQIAAIDRNLFEQLQKNNGAETQRTAELRRQKIEIESQLNALKSQSTNGISNSIKTITQDTGILNEAFSKMKSHVMWMGTAALSGGIAMLPYVIQNIAKTTDIFSQHIKQNLYLFFMYDCYMIIAFSIYILL